MISLLTVMIASNRYHERLLYLYSLDVESTTNLVAKLGFFLWTFSWSFSSVALSSETYKRMWRMTILHHYFAGHQLCRIVYRRESPCFRRGASILEDGSCEKHKLDYLFGRRGWPSCWTLILEQNDLVYVFIITLKNFLQHSLWDVLTKWYSWLSTCN